MGIRGWFSLTMVLLAVVLGMSAALRQSVPTMPQELDFGDGGRVISFELGHVTANSSALQNEEITPAEFTCFHSSFYGGLDAWCELSIAKSGEAVLTSFLGREQRRYTQAKFTLQDSEIAELCSQLRAVNFAQLGDHYDSYLRDGSTYSMTLHCRGLAKEVVCAAHYPQPFANLEKYVNETLVAPHQLELAQAVEISKKQANNSFACPSD